MSGSGGQIDFVRGACQSRGGKSFIAFTSTAKGGTISKIKPILTPGAVCTTSKNDVDYIVTEYGIAHLRGRSLGERTRQLIAIAPVSYTHLAATPEEVAYLILYYASPWASHIFGTKTVIDGANGDGETIRP